MPVHDEQHLFEMLTLEGAQAGLSWRTILYKREGYRQRVRGLRPGAVARFTPARIERLLADPSHRAQPPEGGIDGRERPGGARAGRRGSTLDELVWASSAGRRSINRWREMGEVPAETPASKAMSRRS